MVQSRGVTVIKNQFVNVNADFKPQFSQIASGLVHLARFWVPGHGQNVLHYNQKFNDSSNTWVTSYHFLQLE